MSLKKCEFTGHVFEVTDGPKYKCYTCQSRTFRGRTDYCTRGKILNFDPEQGCKSGWSRRSKYVR